MRAARCRGERRRHRGPATGDPDLGHDPAAGEAAGAVLPAAGALAGGGWGGRGGGHELRLPARAAGSCTPGGRARQPGLILRLRRGLRGTLRSSSGGAGGGALRLAAAELLTGVCSRVTLEHRHYAAQWLGSGESSDTEWRRCGWGAGGCCVGCRGAGLGRTSSPMCAAAEMRRGPSWGSGHGRALRRNQGRRSVRQRRRHGAARPGALCGRRRRRRGGKLQAAAPAGGAQRPARLGRCGPRAQRRGFACCVR